MKKFTLLLILFTLSQYSFSQLSQEKTIERILEIDDYILSEDYKEALVVLAELRDKGIENANLNFKTGFCYLNTISEKSKALPFLKKASEKFSSSYSAENPLEENAPVDALLYLGDAYRLDKKIDEAIACYNDFSKASGNTNTNAQAIAQKRIKECHASKVMLKQPIAIRWGNLGETINQGLGNLNPVLSADGKTMIFTRKMKFYDAIYFSRLENGVWTEAINITTNLGSDGEFYPTGLNSGGDKLLLSTYDMLNGQDIYESTLDGSKWSKVKKLDEGVNSKFPEINACYSPDGKTIYFASNRESGFGGYDLYSSNLNSDGSWSIATNLGNNVNTPYNEKLPRIINNGKQLAFISEGHFNMGGYDLFYINLPLDNINSKPSNFGFPISTSNNDISFYPDANPSAGYIAKNEPESLGETDIYRVEYNTLSSFKEIPVKTNLSISGLNNSDSVSLFLTDALINDTLYSSELSGSSISLDYLLYPGNFTLIAENQDNKSEKTNFTVPSDITNNAFQIPVSIAFKVPEIQTEKLIVENDTVYIQNILFGFNKSAIEKEYFILLDKVADLMQKYPDMQLTVTGYSDALGNSEYNKILSQKRAGSVRNYLEKKGINPARISAVGAGSINFIAINKNSNGTDNPEGRKLNRRIEIVFSKLPVNLIFIKNTNIPKELRP